MSPNIRQISSEGNLRKGIGVMVQRKARSGVDRSPIYPKYLSTTHQSNRYQGSLYAGHITTSGASSPLNRRAADGGNQSSNVSMHNRDRERFYGAFRDMGCLRAA